MMPKKINGINIVPFIDIMLVLLVIVLIEATFTQTDSLILPSSTLAGDGASEKQELSLILTKEGDILLEGSKLSLEDLSTKMRHIDKKTPINIKGDSKSQLQEFVSLLFLLKKLEFNNLSIITEKVKE